MSDEPPRKHATAKPDRRSYGDACATARALDVIGERWALLIVRELLFGPKRFGDLQCSGDGRNGDSTLDLGQIRLGESCSCGKLFQGDPFELAQSLQAPEGVRLCGVGSSWHGGHIVSYLTRKVNRLAALRVVVPTSDARLTALNQHQPLDT